MKTVRSKKKKVHFFNIVEELWRSVFVEISSLKRGYFRNIIALIGKAVVVAMCKGGWYIKLFFKHKEFSPGLKMGISHPYHKLLIPFRDGAEILEKKRTLEDQNQMCMATVCQ